jgi:hypothetical protein
MIKTKSNYMTNDMSASDLINKGSIETFQACEKAYMPGSYESRDFLFKNLHLSIEYCVKGILKQNNKFEPKDRTHSLKDLSTKLFDINDELGAELEKVAEWLDDYGGANRYNNINNKTHSYTEAKNLIKSLHEYCGIYDKSNVSLMPFLPKNIFDFPKSSFALEFKSDHICSNVVTFELRKMLDLLSHKFNTSEVMANSSYIETHEEPRYMISIFGVAMWLREEELNELNDYVKIYRGKFLDKMQNIENGVGALNYELIISSENIAHYKVLRVSYGLWKKIIFFIQKNYNQLIDDHYIVNAICESHVTFNSIKRNQFTNFRLTATYTVDDVRNNTITLLLTYEGNIFNCENISTIEQILKWLISNLIPKAVYINEYGDSFYRKFFTKKYENFVSRFNLSNYALLLNNKEKYSDPESYLKRLKNGLEQNILYNKDYYF